MGAMKVGILGCGHIASKNVGMIKALDGMEVVACAARDIDRAKAFASQFGIERAYGSYAELAEDPEVELVYVTTIHSLHYEHMMLCLNGGKNVICEKAFTVNAEEAEQVFALARSKHLFVSEAIWTRYQPARTLIKHLIQRIGKVTNVSAKLGAKIVWKDRISMPEQGGGAILDLGVYVINFVLMAREGVPISKMAGLCTKNERGADIREEMLFQFEDGSTATMSTDTEADTHKRGIIQGEDGFIEVDNINNPKLIKLWSGTKNSVLMAQYPLNHEYNGYEYEFIAAKNAIEAGRLESYDMPWSETLRVMRLMDGFRRSWGVKLGRELEES